MRAAPALASRIWGAGKSRSSPAPNHPGSSRESRVGGARSWARLCHPNWATPRAVSASAPGATSRPRPSSGSPGLALPQVPPVGHTSASKEGTVRAVGTVVSVPAAPEPKPGLAQRALSPSSAVRQAPPGPGSTPEAASLGSSPPMCQKRMFAAARPTSLLRWPGQARPAAQLCSLSQP